MYHLFIKIDQNSFKCEKLYKEAKMFIQKLKIADEQLDKLHILIKKDQQENDFFSFVRYN
jgi:hypothetical protein